MNLIEVFLLHQRDFPEQFQGKKLKYLWFRLALIFTEWQQVQKYLTVEWIPGKSFLEHLSKFLS